jgi:hypothetical protein
MTDPPSLPDAIHEQAVNFLRVELDLGLTFSEIALQTTSNPDKRARNCSNAVTACKAVLHRMGDVDLTPAESTEIGAKLQHLRIRLAALGQDV